MYMCGELQCLVAHRRCYFACRESRRFVMIAEVWARGDDCLYGGGSMGKGACVKGGCFQVVGPGRQGTVRMAVGIAKL